jgi:hypothetical protein
MNCKHAQQLLLIGVDESLPIATRRDLEAHLATCPTCRRERDRIVQLDQTLVQWVGAAPFAPPAPTRRKLAAAGTRRKVQLRRLVTAGGRAAGAFVLRGAVLAILLLMLLGLGASLGLPQARTLVQFGLQPFGGGEATVPVLPITGDRVWIEAITPQSDTRLELAPMFELQIGYTLASVPEGIISVRLAARPSGQTRYFAIPVRVDRGTNRATVRFVVDDVWARQLLDTDEVQIEVLMRAADVAGEAPLLAHTTYGRWQLP